MSDRHFFAERFPTEQIFCVDVELGAAENDQHYSVGVILSSEDVLQGRLIIDCLHYAVILTIVGFDIEYAGFGAEKRNIFQTLCYGLHE